MEFVVVASYPKQAPRPLKPDFAAKCNGALSQGKRLDMTTVRKYHSFVELQEPCT